MADLILLHTAADAERVVAFALQWRGDRVIPVSVAASDTRLALGAHTVLAGLVTPATHDEAAFTAIVALLVGQRRRAFLIADGVPVPPHPVVDAGLPVVFAALDDAADQEKLRRSVELVARGHWLTSEYEAPQAADATAQAPAAPRARKSAWRTQREAQRVDDVRDRPQPVDYRPVRRVRRVGLLIGSVLGVAVVVAGLAPWAASVARRQSQERAAAAARLEAARQALPPPPAEDAPVDGAVTTGPAAEQTPAAPDASTTPDASIPPDAQTAP
ncbi:MAG: hypothetical protein GC206_05370 [Alphaproteobacteria bacterium]|nr:hypothetical protein [Alphaproteobacteria bacterium]